MKKLLLGLILGYVAHMTYIDLIVFNVYHSLDTCTSEAKGVFATSGDEVAQFDYMICTAGIKTVEEYKGKSFGLYKLYPFKNVKLEWSME